MAITVSPFGFFLIRPNFTKDCTNFAFWEIVFFDKAQVDQYFGQLFQSGLPDFSWYNIPKRENGTKWPKNIPNGHKIYQTAEK
jgi:hypothetical protein